MCFTILHSAARCIDMVPYITFQDDYLGIFTRSYLWQTANCNVFFDGGLASGTKDKLSYLRDGRESVLLLTHGHWDHIGCDSVTKENGGKVLVGRGDARHIADYDWLWQGLFAQFADDFALPAARHTVFWSEVGQPVKPDGYLEDGQVLTFDDAVFRVIAIPGHSMGSVCLLEEHTGIIFCGDGIIGDGFFSGCPQITDFDAYIASMKKLRSVSPSQAVTAHTPVIAGAEWQALLDRSIDCAQRMLRHVAHYAAENDCLTVSGAAKAIADGEGKGIGGGTCTTAVAALMRMNDVRAQKALEGYLLRV